MKEKDLYIIGAGGFGREVAWLTERINKLDKIWTIKGFIDDDVSAHGTMCDTYQILGGCDYLLELEHDVWCVCAIGNAKVRKKIIENLQKNSHIFFATLIDPRAELSDRVLVGEGSIVCAGSIITVDVQIGKHNHINLDCTIGHDADLADFVTLFPSVNVSGNVHIGECAEIGTGSNIIQGKGIGKRTVIGAGTVVINDVADDCTAVGCPARVIKYHTENVWGGVKGNPLFLLTFRQLKNAVKGLMSKSAA